MRPIWKKALIAVAAKKGWDAYQDRRHKPSAVARIGKIGLLVGLGAGVAYLVKSHRLQPLIDQVKGTEAHEETSTYTSSGNGNVAQPAITNV